MLGAQQPLGAVVLGKVGHNAGPPGGLRWEADVTTTPQLLSQRDFRAGDFIQFSRASLGWYWNSAGLLKQADIGQWRASYDPATLVALGWLIEEARTNSMIQSQAMDTVANWTQDFGTITANGVTSPDGTSNADTFVGAAVTADITDLFQLTSNSGDICDSIFIKKGTTKQTDFYWISLMPFSTNDYVTQYFNFTAGTLGTSGVGSNSGTKYGSGVIDAGNSGWKLFWLSGIANTPGASYYFDMGPLKTGSETLNTTGQPTYTDATNYNFAIWQAQREVGFRYPCSPIPTTTAAVTRAAEVTDYQDADYLNAAGFVVYARTAMGNTNTGQQTLCAWSDYTAANRMEIYRDTSGNIKFKSVVGSSQQCDITLAATVADYTNIKVAVNMVAGNYRASCNGGAVVTSGGASRPTCKSFKVGHDGVNANYWNSTIALIQVWQAMTDAQLIANST